MKVRKTLIAVLTLSFTEALHGWQEDPPLRKLSSWYAVQKHGWRPGPRPLSPSRLLLSLNQIHSRAQHFPKLKCNSQVFHFSQPLQYIIIPAYKISKIVNCSPYTVSVHTARMLHTMSACLRSFFASSSITAFASAFRFFASACLTPSVEIQYGPITMLDGREFSRVSLSWRCRSISCFTSAADLSWESYSLKH